MVNTNQLTFGKLIALFNQPWMSPKKDEPFFLVTYEYAENLVTRNGKDGLEMTMKLFILGEDEPIVIWDLYKLKGSSKNEVKERFYEVCVVQLLDLYKRDFTLKS